MTDTLHTRIARATWISHRDRQLAQLGMKPSEYADDLPIPDWAYAIADAVIRELTDAIPPIVATAIQGYAQSGLVALSHHGDDSAIEELKRLNAEALQIAKYATTHEDWNGGFKRYE